MGKHAQLVIGPAGSGKSTFCRTIQEHCALPPLLSVQRPHTALPPCPLQHTALCLSATPLPLSPSPPPSLPPRLLARMHPELRPRSGCPPPPPLTHPNYRPRRSQRCRPSGPPSCKKAKGGSGRPSRRRPEAKLGPRAKRASASGASTSSRGSSRSSPRSRSWRSTATTTGSRSRTRS